MTDDAPPPVDSAARAAAIAACPDCDEYGFVEVDDNTVRRCTHNHPTPARVFSEPLRGGDTTEDQP